jgi:hypothetical protein
MHKRKGDFMKTSTSAIALMILGIFQFSNIVHAKKVTIKNEIDKPVAIVSFENPEKHIATVQPRSTTDVDIPDNLLQDSPKNNPGQPHLRGKVIDAGGNYDPNAWYQNQNFIAIFSGDNTLKFNLSRGALNITK